MDWLLENLWHCLSFLSDGKLKYDGHIKKCGESFGENDEVLGGGANLWWLDTHESAYKEREIFQGDALLPILFCNCPDTSDTHTENT